MNLDLEIITVNSIQNRIYTFRGIQVMIDSDLAELYKVEIKRLNEQVSRNIDRFPENFRFQLTKKEADSLRSQIATLENGRGKHRKYLPYAFTEQGVAMLSAVLRSETAVKVSIQIMDAFVKMRRLLLSNAAIFSRINSVEKDLLEYKTETDNKFYQIFEAIEKKEITPKQGIFFDGQIFDAYKLISDIIKSAQKSIFIVDNYIDESVLVQLAKRKENIETVIFTKNITKQLKLDIEKFNAQYQRIQIVELKTSHDRFMIIDEKTTYHLGASLKDLGKKWFAFTKMENDTIELINKLQHLQGK